MEWRNPSAAIGAVVNQTRMTWAPVARVEAMSHAISAISQPA
jgi:hypothetical protein